MHYTIATLKQADGDLSLDFDKCGKQYIVGLRNSRTPKSTYRKFDDIDEALRKFTELSEILIRGLYSEQRKREILMTD